MAYTKTKYEAENGDIHPLRLTASYAAAAGTVPGGAVTNPIPAKVSKGNREFGLRPRGVRLSRTIGTGATAFTKTGFLPLRSKADATSETYAENSDITVDGITWTIVSRVPEDYR